MGQATRSAGRRTVLLIDAPGAGWDPARGGRSIDLAAALQKDGTKAIVAALAPGQGGVWTDVVQGVEVVRFGYPDPPRPRAFDPFDPQPLPENLLIRHWERIAFGRSVGIVLMWTGRVSGPLRFGLAGQDLFWWGVAADWADWRDLAPMPKRAPRGEPARVRRLFVLVGAGERPDSVTLEPDHPEIEVLEADRLVSRIVEGLESFP